MLPQMGNEPISSSLKTNSCTHIKPEDLLILTIHWFHVRSQALNHNADLLHVDIICQMRYLSKLQWSTFKHVLQSKQGITCTCVHQRKPGSKPGSCCRSASYSHEEHILCFVSCTMAILNFSLYFSHPFRQTGGEDRGRISSGFDKGRREPGTRMSSQWQTPVRRTHTLFNQLNITMGSEKQCAHRCTCIHSSMHCIPFCHSTGVSIVAFYWYPYALCQ